MGALEYIIAEPRRLCIPLLRSITGRVGFTVVKNLRQLSRACLAQSGGGSSMPLPVMIGPRYFSVQFGGQNAYLVVRLLKKLYLNLWGCAGHLHLVHLGFYAMQIDQTTWFTVDSILAALTGVI